MEDPILFALAVLFILGTPGPTNTLLATGGAALGLRRALPLIPAEAAGYSVSILALGLLLGPAVAASPGLSDLLRLAVAAYLVHLALRLWRRGAGPGAGAATVTPGQVFVTTLLNPKAIVLALGVIPFGSGGWGPYMAGFLGLLGLCALGWVSAGAAMGRAAASAGRAGLVPRVGGAAVLGFALLLAAKPLLD